MIRLWAYLTGAALLAVIATLILVAPSPTEKCIVTCSSDAQCGGVVLGTDTYCKGTDLYGSTQQNTCVNAGTCQAHCTTTYADTLVQTCPRACTDHGCT